MNNEAIGIEQGSSNVYADIGITDAEEMLVKARLVTKISEIIKHRHLTQDDAADIVGLPRQDLSGLLRGQFREISQTKMLDCLKKLGNK